MAPVAARRPLTRAGASQELRGPAGALIIPAGVVPARGGLARIRLAEHAIHTWDIAVALDPAATVAADAVALLVDTLGQLVTWTAKPRGQRRRLRVSTSSPVRHYMLDIGETVTLMPTEGNSIRPELALPAEAFVRLVYGRLDPAHTPPVEVTRVDLGELRQVFPGF